MRSPGATGTPPHWIGALTEPPQPLCGPRGTTPREDGWQARLGGWFATGENSRIGAAYSWREASRAGREDPSEVSAYLSYQLSEQVGVSVSGGAGLSDASADYRGGVRLTWRSQRADRRER